MSDHDAARTGARCVGILAFAPETAHVPLDRFNRLPDAPADAEEHVDTVEVETVDWTQPMERFEAVKANLPLPDVAGRAVPLDAWPRVGAVVVYDLEYTAWEGSQERDWSADGEAREVVEIGAVRLDATDGFRERDSFRQLVRPVLNPVLSAYFTRLTGISNASVRADGVGFVEAMRRLAAFAGPTAPLLSHGGDYRVLLENAALWRSGWPFAAGRCGDLRPGLAGFLGVPVGAVVSGDLPARLGLASAGVVHNALDDARAVAAAMRSLRARGAA